MAKPKGNVYAITATSWRVKFPRGKDPVTGKYIPIQETYPTEDTAWARLNKLRVEQAEGTLIAPSKITVAQFAERWLDAKRGDVKPSAMRNYRNALKSIVAYMGHVPLAKVDAPLILAWKAERLTGARLNADQRHRDHGPYHPNTVRLHQTILNMMLGDAVAWMMLPAHPGQGVELPAHIEPEYTVWTRTQIEMFLAHCETHRDGAFWRLMLTTGLRIGEMVALSWDDLFSNKLTVREGESRDEDGRIIVGSPKSRYGRRTLTLSKATLVTLQTYRQNQRVYRERVGDWWNDADWMFPSERGARQRAATMRVKFPKICREAGVPIVRPHDLRHANATDLMRAGVPARVVQQRLGHYDVSFTLRRYSHPDDDMDSDAAEALERSSDTPLVIESFKKDV